MIVFGLILGKQVTILLHVLYLIGLVTSTEYKNNHLFVLPLYDIVTSVYLLLDLKVVLIRVAARMM